MKKLKPLLLLIILLISSCSREYIKPLKVKRNFSGALWIVRHQISTPDKIDKLIYLVASDTMLLKRYRETRRHHPMENESINTSQAIEREREQFHAVSKRADHIIDTSQLLTKEFKQELAEIVLGGPLKESLIITLVSYGVKYGNPVDCDLIFDLRFTPNPYYIDEMKEMTGKDKQVIDYVLGQKATQDFLWGFVREQVEEEATAQGIVDKLKKAGDAGIFFIDSQLGQR